MHVSTDKQYISSRSMALLAYEACARGASGSENRVFLRHHPSSLIVTLGTLRYGLHDVTC